MEIRKLDPTEHSATRSLYEEVFSEDSESFVNYYYTEKTKDNIIYAVTEDGEIRSMIHLNPYDVMVNKKEEKLHYIVAVATQEPYRKRGYMAALLKESLQAMYRQGEPFTYLMPASEKIYYPHDFRTVYEQTTKYWEPSEKKADIRERRAVPKDAASMARMATAALEGNFDVYAKREEEYYVRLMKEYESDGGCLMIGEKDGEILWCCPRVSEIPKERPKIMVRLVGVRRMLLLLDLNYLTAVCFHVTDPLIEENNRCFLITGTEASGVMLMEGKEENSEGTLTVGALARLIFGAASVEEIAEEKGVKMSDRMKNELKKIVPLSRIFLNEVV
ncbi:GNAT family N-acetyltransferase [Claveliimonas bilis]|uniref:N-acetyltransferase domain-containing protein n=1 Tax=Claveliimonas bilis TaxID=3028070 RepID=A0ABM8I9Q5_9FIRM|nr:GNAT family N-acetyltransferase [Claveliimonas bilis]BDZ77186.1 hypothetical protein Lac1_13690 [Claveliimonas bilis]